MQFEPEAQAQEHQLAQQIPQDTPQEHHEQQNQVLDQHGLPQAHQDLPPGHHEAAQGEHNMP